MANPKTTTSGYMLIVAAVISAAAKIMTGHLPDMADFTLLVTGIGLVTAKDGQH